MRYVKIKSLPKVYSAHVFSSPRYINELPVAENKLEICYIAKGVNHVRQGEHSSVEHGCDFSCNLYDEITYVRTEAFHEHHTVIAKVEFDILQEDEEGALLLPRRIVCPEKRKIHELVDEMISLHTLTPAAHVRMSGLFLDILAEMDELARKSAYKANGLSLYVKRAKEYAYQNLSRPITQKEVAEYLGITPEYLCYAFKSVGEQSFITFLNKEKLTKIRTMMTRENMKLYEAAELYGYADANYVSRLYKKYFGKNITE